METLLARFRSIATPAHGGRSGERGLTLVETMVAIGILVSLVVGIVVVSRSVAYSASAIGKSQHTVVEFGKFVDTLETTAQGSVAVYAPSSTEVAFYSEKNDRTPDVYSYRFQAGANGAPGTVQEYHWDKPGGTATPIGQPLTGFTSFNVTGYAAGDPTAPDSAPISALFSGMTLKSHEIATGFPGVIGGTHETFVKATVMGPNHTPETRMFLLDAGVLLSGSKTVVSLYTPAPGSPGSPIGPMSANPVPLTFANPTAPPQSFTVNDDPNYVGLVPKGGGLFLQTSTTCGTDSKGTPVIQSITPGAYVPVSGAQGYTQPFSVKPNPAAVLATTYTCQVVYEDEFQLATRTATETISVGPNPVGPLTVLPAAIALPVSGQTLVAGANIGTYSDPGAIMNRLMGGGIALAASTCTAIAYTANFAAIDTNAADDAAINAPGGCYTGAPGSANGPLVNASEPGFTSAFGVPGSTCGVIIQFLGWNPASGNGPNADLGLSGSAVGQCAFSVSGASGSSAQSVAARVTGGCVPGQVCGALGENINSDGGLPCHVIPMRGCIGGELPYYQQQDNQYDSMDGGFTWVSDGTATCGSVYATTLNILRTYMCTPALFTGVTTTLPLTSIIYVGQNSYDSRIGITSQSCTWSPSQPPGTLNGGSWPNPGC